MKLWRALRGASGDVSRFSIADLAKAYSDGGGLFTTSPWLKQEELEHSFLDYVQNAYKQSGPVFACQLARTRIFSQARFQWADFAGAKPGKLFGTPELGLLERPWPNGSTNELLARMIQDADLAGNAYVAREGGRLRRLRPDWVEIVLSAPPAEAVESDVVGYLYRPGGQGGGAPRVYLPDELAHWTPIPDPEAQYRGMSWLTPVVREIRADKAATQHKLSFFENAATPNLAVSFKDSVSDEQFDAFMETLNGAHQGARNAYKTLYLAGGADVTVIGADLKQLDFKVVQGAGETRIANAAGVPAVIVGLSEGLAGSSLNAGNYNAARRNFADGTLQDLWVGVCAALETVVRAPSGTARLWFDKTQIPFLREDAENVAKIQQMQATALRSLVDAGFEPNAAVAFLQGDDLSALTGQHSGLYSVQLQPPGSGQDPAKEGGSGDAA
ncbi:phage portal protein [Micromonospora arida]|uniref:phage portal protein n=1 Tax=Micromonospora arida TaxID=2203715 RepID=UPI0033B74085